MKEQEKSDRLKLFGETVRRFRQINNQSQEELADCAGIDRSYLGAIERGEHNLALLNIIKIAKGLGISPHKLLEGYASSKEK